MFSGCGFIHEEKSMRCCDCEGAGVVSGICNWCNGSGEGRHETQRCINCGGGGEVGVSSDECGGIGEVEDEE